MNKEESKGEEIMICRSCGHPEAQHNFRHCGVFDRSIIVSYEDDIPTLTIDLSQWPAEIHGTLKCMYPQCGKEKYLHGGLFRHEFVSSGEPPRYRIAHIAIPSKLKCSKCEKTYGEHKYHTDKTGFSDHKFLFRTVYKNKESSDVVKFSGNNTYEIEDMSESSPRVETFIWKTNDE